MVIMLAGMDDLTLQSVVVPGGPVNGRDFHEVRTRSGDEKHFHGAFPENGLAGFPQTMEPDFTDAVTTDPGAMIASSPIVTPFITMLLAPMETRLPIHTLHFSRLSSTGAPRSLWMEWK